MNISTCSCHDFLYLFLQKKERICLTQDKKSHHEDKKRVMNLQQGHVIMQWPSQARLHRWVELVSLDHKLSQPTLFSKMGGYLKVRDHSLTSLTEKKITLSSCADQWIISVAYSAHTYSIKQSRWTHRHTVALNEHCRLKDELTCQVFPQLRLVHHWIFAWNHQYVTMVTNQWLVGQIIYPVNTILTWHSTLSIHLVVCKKSDNGHEVSM